MNPSKPKKDKDKGKEKKEINQVEIEKGRLYWISDISPPKCKVTKAFYFCIDQNLEYEPFSRDFGPLNLAMTHKYCLEIDRLMNNNEFKNHKIYHYTSTEYDKRANAAYLMCAYLVIYKKKSPEEAIDYFKNVSPPFVPFRDATEAEECDYKCTILDCLRGLKYAIDLKWYNPATFDVNDYESYENLENGDMNWIIPGKLLAFSSPFKDPYDSDGYRVFTPEDYVPIFKEKKIGTVVRLNNPHYDARIFVKNNIKHKDLYFVDGSTPPDDIVKQFLTVCENEKNAVAVHCKAGLGRTGTLIALYAMKHYRFPAAAFIAYIRICRPGSILGPQQEYLIENEEKMFKLGNEYRKEKKLDDSMCLKMEKIKLSDDHKKGYSLKDKEILKHGDVGQGESLVDKKKKK